MSDRLSPSFTVAEFERSQAASRLGIRNRMGPSQRTAAEALCREVLEPLRTVVGPVSVSSGYRAPKVNAAVGGSSSSQHMRGEAADIACNALSVAELFDLIRLLRLPYDQVLEEWGAWVHVSHSRRHRRQAMVVRTVRGRTTYTAAKAPVLTEDMKEVVKAYQRRVGIGMDGIPGNETRRSLGILS